LSFLFFSVAISASCCRTYQQQAGDVLQRGFAMASDSDFVLIGPPHTNDGMMIVWQVSLYWRNTDPTWMTDWRDVSMVHSCILETAHKERIRHVTLPAPQSAPDVPSASEDFGDWVVDLEELTQMNTKTEARRRIRRCVITGPRTT
jgi:hypothetical protein